VLEREVEHGLVRVVRRCTLPLIAGVSKNRRWRTSFRSKCVFKTQAAKESDDLWREILMDNLIVENMSLDTIKPKVLVICSVHQPYNLMDPVNSIDAVCDVVKTVLPVDDKYYSIFLSWENSKVRERFVEIEVWARVF